MCAVVNYPSRASFGKKLWKKNQWNKIKKLPNAPVRLFCNLLKRFAEVERQVGGYRDIALCREIKQDKRATEEEWNRQIYTETVFNIRCVQKLLRWALSLSLSLTLFDN